MHAEFSLEVNMNISFEDFKKIDLRIATIEDVEDHPNADRLYVLKLKVGEVSKQIVAGIKAHYSKDELKGKRIVIVNNLEPVVLRGVESNGMLLATKTDDLFAVLTTDRLMDDGVTVG